MSCPDRRRSLGLRSANSSLLLTTARHEHELHWCGSLWLARPSLSEQGRFATAR
ncbi:hypothetical protein L195_g063064 [Trifolium pratense]|uniref:Uncharacterized protein n=1 Tax=Trifolium pratense TaxID=57577 RepID=A0A2K3KJK0_TRIPR|nr:hypothetical protein L195_g063064 [Trifolium pratense]